jgi:predicted thioesterase
VNGSIEPGTVGRASMIVEDSDTAIALGSGDVAVLGTPRLVALCEEATVDAVTDMLASDHTTVGTRVELDHLAPSKIGDAIVATARLDAVDGSRLRFSVTASDGRRDIGRGVVVRAVVDRERFA